MKPKRDPKLPEWVEELGRLLWTYFDDPQHWHLAMDRAQVAQCDTVALMQQRSEAGRLILLSALKMGLKMALPPGTSAALLLGPDAATMRAALDWWAVGAADHAQRVLFDHWGDHLPPGVPQLQGQRRTRLVEQALASRRPGETMGDILARAGVSRQHGYRILDKKSKK